MAICERRTLLACNWQEGSVSLYGWCELSGPLSWAFPQMVGFSHGLFTYLLFIYVNARWQWSSTNNPGKPCGSGGLLISPLSSSLSSIYALIHSHMYS